MKHLSIILTILLCASTAWGRMGVLTLGGGGGAADPCAGTLICEGFEGTGTPSGWTVSGTTFNFDATTTLIDGSQYLSADYSGSPGYVSIPVTTSGEVYVAAKMRYRTFVNDTGSEVIRVYSSGVEIGKIESSITGYIHSYAVGGTASTFSPVFTLNTALYIKVRFLKGTGSDAIVQSWYSSDGKSWTLIGTSSDGTSTANPTEVRIAMKDSAAWDIDSLIIKTSDINY